MTVEKLIKRFCCSDCKKDNIEFKVWADENNIMSSYGLDDNECWCMDCQEHTTCELKEKQYASS